MNRYSVSSKTVATGVTIDVAIAALWNPSTVKPIWVEAIHLMKQAIGAADEAKLRRISTRGTAGTTATPTIANDYDHELAPLSGALLDMNHSVQPTFVGVSGTGGDLKSVVIPAAVGAGVMWIEGGPWRVKAGAGLCVCTGIALAFPASRVTFIWAE